MTAKVKIGASELQDALIDSGSELNLISSPFAKQLGLKLQPLPSLEAEAANGSSIPIDGATTVEVAVTDARGRVRHQMVPFVVCALRKFPVYLGLPWIDAYNPKLNFATRRMLHRGGKIRDHPLVAKVGIEEAEEFDKSMRDPTAYVFACVVAPKDEGAAIWPKLDQLPPQYAEFADICSDKEARELAKHSQHDLAINLVPEGQPPHQPIYNLSASELDILRRYLKEYLERGWIRRSRSPAGAPILFVKKKDGSLRLCVDYRGLNKVTIKNRHPLPLISESLERLAEAKYYSKLDVRDAYHRIRIKEGDEWKTAFRTKYGHFEYTVMPFGLTNAPAQFQAYINQALIGLVDVTCIVYLDDILIFSKTEKEHVEHVKEVLARLREAKLYVKLSKCEWHTQRTEYLGYIVTPEGIRMDEDRIKTITEWPMPRTVRDIRVFVGFMNYYRRFIRNFSKLALPLTKLTQKGPNQAKGGRAQRREESVEIGLGREAEASFGALKQAFTDVPILAHWEPGRETKVEVDASGGAICGILSQLVPQDGPDWANSAVWRPIDFYSRKLIQAEYNYDTHDQELLAMVKSLEHWRHYLEGTRFKILTDHANLKWFMETKTLNHRQVRAYLTLTRYDFTLEHRPGSSNPADGPSRRPDYMAEAQRPAQKYNQAFVQPMQRLLSSRGLQGTASVDAVTTRSKGKSEDEPNLREAMREYREVERAALSSPAALEGEVDTETESEDSSSTDGEKDTDNPQNGPKQAKLGRYAVITLTSLEGKRKALEECHYDPMAGHFGYRKTLEKLKRRYWWKGMAKEVNAWCRACLRCKMATSTRHRPYGPLAPLPPPDRAWEEVTFDFITDLPQCRQSGVDYDSIMVIVDRLTKMAHYVPARSDWDGKDLGYVWIREIIRLHGVPKRIISDRGPLMNAKHWETFNHYLNARRVLTSAYHPQTDGQTERQNQTLEQYLRIYCALEQDDWVQWLPLAEFAYNDSTHATTKMSPFQANTGLDPRRADWPDLGLGEGESPLGHEMAAKVISLQRICKQNIESANAYQKEYADKKRMPIPFKIGDKVLLSNKNIKSQRPRKKLDWKYIGPGTVEEQIGSSAFKVNIPGLHNVHPVFHASLLEPYSDNTLIPHPNLPIVDVLRSFGDDVYEVEKIIQRRQNSSGGWEYLIKWKGYSAEENSWEPGSFISGNTLQKFWKDHNILPKRAPSQIKPLRRRGRPPKKKDGKSG